MRYIKIELMYGVPDEEVAEWSEQADKNFSAARFHAPLQEEYVISQEMDFIAPEDVEKLKYSFFTEEGGV